MSDKELHITDYHYDIGSDSEAEISLNDSGSCESLLLDFSSDQETESLDNITHVRNFVKLIQVILFHHRRDFLS